MSKKNIVTVILPTALVLAATISLVGPAMPAHAASTWLPVFDAAQTVYLDPALRTDSVAPVNLDSLAPQLAAEARKHGLKPYLVMAKKGDNVFPNCQQKFAVCELEELMGRWSAKLPQDDYVLLLVVRSDEDWTKVSYAVNVGNRARALGVGPTNLNLDKWAKGADGGVAYLPRDPGNFAVHVVTDINDLMDKGIADQKAAVERQKFIADLPGYLMIGTGILGAIALGLYLSIRFARESKRAAQSIAQWQASLANANNNYIEIQSNYLAFLNEQGNDWRTRFVGETLSRYQQAVKDYASLSSRIAAANDRLTAAGRAASSGNLFSVDGFVKAVELLTEASVTVTGDLLPFEERTLFGSEVEENTYAPGELLHNMDELFQSTNSALAQILKAFDDANQNGQKVADSLEDVLGKTEALRTANIKTGSFEQRLSDIELGTEVYQEKVGTNPLAAASESFRVLELAAALVTDLNAALVLAGALAKVESSLASARDTVAQKRGEKVVYAYPGVDTPSNSAKTFLLNEAGFNPDAIALDAAKRIAAARSFLDDGSLDQATAEKDNAVGKVQQILETIKQSVAAKDAVVQKIVSIFGMLSKLNEEIPAARVALTQLIADYLEVNFGSLKDNVSQAESLAAETLNRLAVVEAAYFEQRFIAASRQLLSIGDDIQTRQDGLVSLRKTLETLGRLRADSRRTSQLIQEQLPILEARMKETAFTTSRGTQGEFDRNKQLALGLASQVASEKADWVKSANDIRLVHDCLQKVGEAIETELGSYDGLIRDLTSCNNRRAAVQALVAGNFVRSRARTELENACRSISAIEQSVRVAQSDWKALSQSLSQAESKLNEAESTARSDIHLAVEAGDAISRAESELSSVPGSFGVSRSIGCSYRSFGSNIYADTSSAAILLERARSAHQSQDYEGAASLAKQSVSASQKAKAEAERQVQDQINAAIAQWEYEERMRREAAEAEARRIREAEDASRRASESYYSSSTSSSSWDTSSSGSFGGDSGGGSGSFGGGDF